LKRHGQTGQRLRVNGCGTTLLKKGLTESPLKRHGQTGQRLLRVNGCGTSLFKKGLTEKPLETAWSNRSTVAAGQRLWHKLIKKMFDLKRNENIKNRPAPSLSNKSSRKIRPIK